MEKCNVTNHYMKPVVTIVNASSLVSGSGEKVAMKLPCERGVWYILPSIRACLVYELMQRGLSQRDVATRMGLTPAAVCQYAARKRGAKVYFGADAIRAIQDLAEDMAGEQVEDVAIRMCAICTRVREDIPRCDTLKCFGEPDSP